MSSGNWGIEAFIWHDPTVYVRWHTHSDGIIQLPPLQVQGIPGEYINYYYGTFTREGTWLVTNGSGDNPPGVVFRASYPDGEYHEIARLPDINGEPYSVLPYPGGIVAMQEGTRQVYLITANGGITMSQELPPTPMDGAEGSGKMRLLMVCYVPDPLGVGKISIAVGMNGSLGTPILEPGDTITDVVGAVYSELTVPGAHFVMRPEFVVVPRFARAHNDVEDGCWRLAAITPTLYSVRNTMCVTGAAYQDGDSMYNIVEASADNLHIYSLQTPDEANPVQPIGMVGKPVAVEYKFDVEWPGGSAVGSVYGVRAFLPGTWFVPAPPDVLSVIGGSYYYGGDLVWAPAPVSPPFWTSFVRSIEELDGEFLPPQPDPDPDPDPDPSDDIVIVMLAGSHPEAPGIGYFPGMEMGGVDSDTLQVGGQSGTLLLLVYDYDVGELVMSVDNLNGITSITLRIDGGEAITLSLTPDLLWTAELAESPFVGGQSYRLDLHIEVAEEPSEGEQYADVILHAEDYGPPGLGYTGFRAEIPGELEGFGSAAPLLLDIGGVVCTLEEISHSYSDNQTVFALYGVYGVTGASMVVDGVAFSMEFDTFEQYVLAWVDGAESPFVNGQTHDVRIYLEGDLSGDIPDPGEQYVDFRLTASEWDDPEIAGGVNSGYTLYGPWGVEGSVEPETVSMAGIEFTVAGCVHYGGSDFLGMFIYDLWGATSGKLVIEGVEYHLEVDEDDAGIFGFMLLNVSPFADGQTYDIRLYLEGDLRDTY